MINDELITKLIIRINILYDFYGKRRNHNMINKLLYYKNILITYKYCLVCNENCNVKNKYFHMINNYFTKYPKNTLL